MARTNEKKKGFLLTNCTLIDGTGREPVKNAAVLVEGERIKKVFTPNPKSQTPNPKHPNTQTPKHLNGYQEVNLRGMTLMPGLVEAHYHVSYWGAKELADLDLKLPPEECTIYAVRNAELILRCGYTSVCSAGSLHRVDVAVRDLIESGVLAGPRMLASGRDICATGGMLDWNPSYWKLGMEGLAIFADGVDEVRKAARKMIKEGVDVIKIYVTGEGLLRPWAPPEETMMTYDEIAAAVDEGHRRGKLVMAHVRGADGVKICVRAGVDIIHHATFSDDEAIELIAEHKDRIFVVPALGYTWAAAYKGTQYGIPPEVIEMSRYKEEFDVGCKNMLKLKEAGVRVLPGGDYGFVWCPHGEEPKDLEIFVKHIGFSPMETIVAATKWGSEIMRMPDDIGTVEAGKYADLLVVDGDPLKDITIFQDRRRIQLVMKGGVVMCNRLGLPQVLGEDYSIEEHLQHRWQTDGYRRERKPSVVTERGKEVAKLLART